MPLKKQSDKEDLKLQLQAARSSTASMGKFDSKVKNDTKAHKSGKKRKVSSTYIVTKHDFFSFSQLYLFDSLKVLI